MLERYIKWAAHTLPTYSRSFKVLLIEEAPHADLWWMLGNAKEVDNQVWLNLGVPSKCSFLLDVYSKIPILITIVLVYFLYCFDHRNDLYCPSVVPHHKIKWSFLIARASDARLKALESDSSWDRHLLIHFALELNEHHMRVASLGAYYFIRTLSLSDCWTH